MYIQMHIVNGMDTGGGQHRPSRTITALVLRELRQCPRWCFIFKGAF